MSNFTIDVTNDTATPKVSNLIRLLGTARTINAIAARTGEGVIKGHLKNVPMTRRNKNNFPTTRFWGRAHRATRSTYTDASATVTIDQPGVALQYYGGEVKAKKSQYLTIPVSANSYGHRASHFRDEKTFCFTSKKGNKFIARRPRGGELELLYLLRKSANVPADKSVLPPLEEIKDAVVAKIKEATERL